MNQPIRTAPLPFLKANGEAAAEAPPCTEAISGDSSEFGELLNAELGETAPLRENSSEQEEKAKNGEAVEVYGIAPVLLLLTQQAPPLPVAIEHSHTLPEQPQTLLPNGVNSELNSVDLSPETTESDSKGIKDVPLPKPETSNTAISAIAEQKVPIPPEEVLPQPEQITEKGPEPAKKSHGMVVAQPPAMLMTNQQEKNALPPEQPLLLQHFEAPAFEQAIRVEPLQTKATRSDKVESLDPSSIETDLLQSPRFEVVSGEVELQPVRPVEPTALVEAIRTHIELLKTSSAEKLDVILRPDAQTELNIQVEKVNGQIQVQVRCDRGDFAALESQWSNIQNTLAAQGIRVEPLQQGAGAQLRQDGSNQFQNFSQQHSNHREERSTPIFEQEFPNREANRPKGSRAAAGRGWQSWA